MNKYKQELKDKIKNAAPRREAFEAKAIENLNKLRELLDVNDEDLKMQYNLRISVMCGKYKILALPNTDFYIRKPDYKYYAIPYESGSPVEPNEFEDVLNAVEAHLSGIEIGVIK
jgi:hypothetical protein|tara:strand:- start:1567 stop:1911 length:345 start_codon:yes stop_codon:yes gene_type:complete